MGTLAGPTTSGVNDWRCRMIDPRWATADWRKSSRSSSSSSCVEWASVGDLVGVRHSRRPDGDILEFPAPAWRSFVEAVRAGEVTRR
jgi:hypothetical protein